MGRASGQVGRLAGGWDSGRGLIREAWLVVTDPTPGRPQPGGARGKGSVHVLLTLWSYKELRWALQRDGWTKAHFQVRAALPYAGSSPSRRRRCCKLTPALCLYLVLSQSAAVASKVLKGAQSPGGLGGFDDSMLPLVVKDLGARG